MEIEIFMYVFSTVSVLVKLSQVILLIFRT